MPKAASRTVKKGEALLGVITFDNLVSAVAHVAAQGLPGICADPTLPEKERTETSRGDVREVHENQSTSSNGVAGTRKRQRATFYAFDSVFTDCEPREKDSRSRTSAQGGGSVFLECPGSPEK